MCGTRNKNKRQTSYIYICVCVCALLLFLMRRLEKSFGRRAGEDIFPSYILQSSCWRTTTDNINKSSSKSVYRKREIDRYIERKRNEAQDTSEWIARVLESGGDCWLAAALYTVVGRECTSS